MFTDEDFKQPSARVSPNELDYLDRVEAEIREREDNEFFEQALTPGYMRTLRDLFEEIDEWLELGGGVASVPDSFKRFVRHPWCCRKLPREERIRISKLRLQFDMLLQEEDDRKEAKFWEEVEANEPNARTLMPSCSICQFDLWNESFSIVRLSCGHTFHKRCLDTHFNPENNNWRCPNCNMNVNDAGERAHLKYQSKLKQKVCNYY